MENKINRANFLNQWKSNLSWLKIPHQELLFDQSRLTPTNRKLFYANIGLIILAILVFIISYIFLPPIIPLFYSRPDSSQQLVGKNQLFLIPTIMFGLTLTASIIDKKMEFADEVISRSLFGSTLLFNLMLFITLVNIIWLII